MFLFNILFKSKPKTFVVTVLGSGFGVNGEGYIRISFVTPIERLQTAINRIKVFAERIK